MRDNLSEPPMGWLILLLLFVLGFGMRSLTVKLFQDKSSIKGQTKPIGISEYQLTKSLPKNLQDSLPSIEQIEEEFE